MDKKSIAIMQPYFFPYIGYFQLIKGVDDFVIYDDVSFIKQGWISRNRILVNGQKHMLTIQLSGASSFKQIRNIEVGANAHKLLKTIHQAYSKAPFFKEAYPVIEKALSEKETNLSLFLANCLRDVCVYIGISTPLRFSSDIEKNIELKGQDKVLEICKKLNATKYINTIGGQSLYSKKIFKEQQIDLKFIRPKKIVYPQFKNEFIPWLSIIDVMMFNPASKICDYLNEYELV